MVPCGIGVLRSQELYHQFGSQDKDRAQLRAGFRKKIGGKFWRRDVS